MVRVPAGASRGLRWGCLGLATAVALVAAVDTADARSKRKRYHAKKVHHAQKYNPPYAAIVIDAKTGATLHQSSPDALRHPASLTKVMTLYLLFEQLETGKIDLNSRIEFSAAASAQPPTKIGLRPGQTIAVEDAIKALVTKSANDVAVAVAEALGGTEDTFARHMTRKAHALGMTRTVYRNASGLPDGDQVTTARDQALLGIAIQERFPRFYRYFSTTSFVHNGRSIQNHNRLLGQVDGVDGIKTGYTRASGFNLLTSMRQGDRRVVAVVLGGKSSRQRDARMAELVRGHIAMASTQRPYSRVAQAPAPKVEPAAPQQLASAINLPFKLPPLPSQPQQPRAAEADAGVQDTPIGSAEPIKPVQVKTVAVTMVPPRRPAPVHTASVPPAPAAAAPAAQPRQAAPSNVPPPGARPGVLGVLPAAAVEAKPAPAKLAQAEPTASRAAPRGGWAIQVGAFEEESEAKQRLTAAQNKAAAILGRADPYTERTVKGDKTYYRARFAGFDRDQAQAACRQLKRSDIVCMPLKM
ncbi:MAG: peptidase M15 [Alphaproteobacteria bacterium]|nr:peptidase M15 [Alphaproteobacteria bacterium]